MSGDLISRQAVLDLIRSLTRWCVRSEDGKFNNVGLLYDDVMFGIDKLPPVNPQEPMSRDCVSRDYLLSLANKDGAYGYVSAHEIINAPSVNLQEPKTGHWIEKYHEVFKYYCDKCGTGSDLRTNYCPNCGCRMVEPQESDHKCHTCKHYTSGERDGSCGSYICKGYSNWESEG